MRICNDVIGVVYVVVGKANFEHAGAHTRAHYPLACGRREFADDRKQERKVIRAWKEGWRHRAKASSGVSSRLFNETLTSSPIRFSPWKTYRFSCFVHGCIDTPPFPLCREHDHKFVRHCSLAMHWFSHELFFAQPFTRIVLRVTGTCRFHSYRVFALSMNSHITDFDNK